MAKIMYQVNSPDGLYYLIEAEDSEEAINSLRCACRTINGCLNPAEIPSEVEAFEAPQDKLMILQNAPRLPGF